jgi:two-component system cell cycle sensor histidine kinase/response regulator CckA
VVKFEQRLGREIAEREHTEEALRESELGYRTLFENAPVGFGLATSDGRILMCNDKLVQISGYSEAELLRINVRDAYQNPEESDLLFERLGTEGFVRGYETVFRRKDGTSYYAKLTIAPFPLGDEEIWLAVIEDITERKQVEQALQRSEEHFRAVIENASDIIMILNADGTIRYGSPSVERLLGYEPQDFLGRTPSEFVHPDDLPVVRNAFIRSVRELGITLQIEFRLRHQDGSWRVVEAIGNNLLDAPAVTGIVVNARDVTERKQAEAALREQTHALRESEELLNNILTASSVGIAHAKDRNIVWANEAMVRMFGFTEEERYLGKDTQILYASEEEYRRVGRITYEQQRAGKVVELDAKFKRQDGSLFDGYVRVNTLDPLDPIKGIIVSIIDITERKQAEEERSRLLVQIQEQARRIEQIMDTVPAGVLLLDAAGRVVLANPVAERDLSVLADARVGDIITRLGDRPLMELLTSPPKGLWHEVKTDTRTFEIIARPMENGPEPENWVLVISDVTREREIRRRAQQHERLAAVGQLAAGIAHDFNNIMATIVLYAQMSAQAEGVSDLIRRRMETINQQAQHATGLIQQILDFGRRAMLERRPLDLLPLLKEQVKLLKRTLPESIEIELLYGPEEYIVNADLTRMQQMVMNLAVNARDAMPEGGGLRIGLERIRIGEGEATPLPEMQAGEWVRMTVSDTGVGIPPDVLPRIYEPFFTTKAPLGSGLGLSQVHGIVAQHEGHIDVRTQRGQGTTFTIYLPALSVRGPETSPPRTAHLPQGEGQTILVVEDNAATRQALMEGLELLSYCVLEAANGQEALVVLEQRKGDVALVLSDVVMPGMGGVALFHTLREKYPAVRMVLLTGHPMEDALKDLRAQGLHIWLFKPPSLKQLAEVIAQALEES